MIRRVIIDIDDTLNEFSRIAINHVCNLSISKDEYYKNYPIEIGYDIFAAAIHFGFTGTPSSFWKSIPQYLWRDAPISDQYNLILDFAGLLVGRKNVCIASSPTLDPYCLAGKTEWVQRVLPRWLWRQVDIGAAKHFKAHPEALLIDDSYGNVSTFREWGGHAILVPRPWNHLYAEDTSQSLGETFKAYLQQQDLFEELCAENSCN